MSVTRTSKERPVTEKMLELRGSSLQRRGPRAEQQRVRDEIIEQLDPFHVSAQLELPAVSLARVGAVD